MLDILLFLKSLIHHIQIIFYDLGNCHRHRTKFNGISEHGLKTLSGDVIGSHQIYILDAITNISHFPHLPIITECTNLANIITHKIVIFCINIRCKQFFRSIYSKLSINFHSGESSEKRKEKTGLLKMNTYRHTKLM